MAEIGKRSGIDVLLKINDTVVAGQTGLSLERNMDTIETTTKENSGWREYIGSLKSWSVSCDGAIVFGSTSFKALSTAFNAGNPIQIEVSEPTGDKYTGSVLITSFPIEAPYDDTCTYSLSLQGTGQLTEVAAPAKAAVK